jgi:hypothetical protein
MKLDIGQQDIVVVSYLRMLDVVVSYIVNAKFNVEYKQ